MELSLILLGFLATHWRCSIRARWQRLHLLAYDDDRDSVCNLADLQNPGK